MIGPIDLWSPSHVTLTVDLMTAFLLGLVHGITPDEHTWPITFSYAVGGYSTARGLRAGLLFSLALAVQASLASELAHLGLTQWFTFESFDNVVYVFDTTTGAVTSIKVGKEPHGLAVWPQPGRYSLGHTGNLR